MDIDKTTRRGSENSEGGFAPEGPEDRFGDTMRMLNTFYAITN